MEYKVSAEESGSRLDAFLVAKSGGKTRAYLQKLIKSGDVSVNGKSSKTGAVLREGYVVFIKFPEALVIDVKPVDIPLKILHEDDDILVIDKEAGMVVHPSATGSHLDDSIVNAVLFHCKDLKPISGELRPGIVHRLDKDTSGVLVVAKSDEAHQSLMNQFKDRKVEKKYVTLVCGHVAPEEAVVDSPIGRSFKDRKKMSIVDEGSGRNAVTEYKIKDVYTDKMGSYSLVDINLKTGRTHQIRVHMNAIGFPVVGDVIYGNARINRRFGKSYDLERQFLHARSLTLTHPTSGKVMEFESKLPDDLEFVLSSLELD